MTFGGRIIHIDPYSRVADYTNLPKADLIFLTHDHLDHAALQSVRTTNTVVVLPLFAPTGYLGHCHEKWRYQDGAGHQG